VQDLANALERDAIGAADTGRAVAGPQVQRQAPDLRDVAELEELQGDLDAALLDMDELCDILCQPLTTIDAISKK
jgi:hypothetical protein